MRTLARILSVIVLFFAAPALAQAPPVEAFGNLPAVSDAAISPDGSKIALALAREGTAYIMVVDLNTGQRVYMGEVGENTQLRGVSFADDGRVAYVVSQTFAPGRVLPSYVRFRGAPRRVDYYRTGVIDLASQRPITLTINDANEWADTGSFLIAPIEGDPGYGRMIGRGRAIDSRAPALYRMNLSNGRSSDIRIRGSNPETLAYLLDDHGAVVARADSDRESNRWRVFVYDGDEPRMLMEDVSDTGAPINMQGLLDDGRLVALDEEETGEFFVLYAIDRATGEREVLFAREGREVDSAIVDPWTRRVIGARWTEGEARAHYFDPTLSAIAERVAALFEDASASIVTWSRDRARVVLYVEQALDGGGYYLFTPADNSIRRISMRYPPLADIDMGVRQSITYPARDGTRIPAFLTLPVVDNPRNLPLVLLVHGGPHSRDTMDFDWWATFLASRGYAVLQPNFRGSSGYGAAWEDAGRGQWGGLMQTDVEDGVASLVRSGYVDPARVCIVGASYGGYAALAGATLTPERYRCAASVAGVSDLAEFLRVRQEQSGGDESMQSDFWRMSIGDRQEDRDRIRSVSPANLADRVRIPVLLIHGTDDTVVPIAQSRRMLDRLRDANKDVRFVELAGDDHWLSDAPTRIQMLRELETFLARNLGTQ